MYIYIEREREKEREMKGDKPHIISICLFLYF